MQTALRWPVQLAALLTVGLAAPSLATIPERVPPYVGQLPPGQWIVEPDPARPCAGFCEAASYQPPLKVYVRETRTEKWGNQTTYIIEVDGCGASTNTWAETTGLSVVQRVDLLRGRARDAARSLSEYCHRPGLVPADVDGAAALFERFDGH